MINKKSETYSKRTWLNPEYSASTGSIVAFHGKTTYGQCDPELTTFLEIADCHGKVKIHKIKIDSMEDYIIKLRTLSEEIEDFADFLMEIEKEKNK
jgi:hypothetical protein